MIVNVYSAIDKLTSILLVLYIISLTAFENYAPTTWIASYSLYLFLIIGLMSIIIKGKIKITYYTISVIAYGILLAFTLFWTKVSAYGFTTFYWYVTCVIMTFIVVNHVDTQKKFFHIVNAYIAGGVAISLLLYIVYGLDIFSVAANSNFGIRIGGDVGNSNAIGLCLGYAVCFAFYRLANFKHTILEKMFYIVSIIICLPILFLTGSKKALLVLLFGTTFIFLTVQKDGGNMVNKVKGVILTVGLLFVMYWLLNYIPAFWYINQRVDDMLMTFSGQSVSDTDLTRIHMIKTSLAEFGNAPFWGNGIAHSRFMFGTYSHNNYVEILMNTGIIGFFIYYSMYAVSIYKSVTLFKHEIKITTIAVFILLTLLIIEMGLVSYYTRYYQVLLAAISAGLGLKGVKDV